MDTLRAISPEDIVRRQQVMADHTADLVYEEPGSRMGSNILAAVMKYRNYTMRG